MNMTYLLLDLGLLALAILLIFISKNGFAANRKYIGLAVMINVFAFSIPTEFLTQLKVIVFNPPYLTGTILWQLPVEELLALLALPLMGLAVYLFLNSRYPDQKYQPYSLALSNLMLGVCIAMLYFGYQKYYTLFTFAILLLLLLYIEYVNNLRFMYRFYRAFLVSLVPFYIFYGIAANLPVVQFHQEATLDFNLLGLPFETPFYYMSMMLFSVYFYELFKSRAKS